MIKYKLSEIAKNLNVTSKEVSEVLKTYLNVNKKAGAVLTSEELNIIFEYFTHKTMLPNLNEYYASANEPAEEKPAPAPKAKKEDKEKAKDKQPKPDDAKPVQQKKPAAQKNDKKPQQKEQQPAVQNEQAKSSTAARLLPRITPRSAKTGARS